MEITSYGSHNSNKSHDWFGKKKSPVAVLPTIMILRETNGK